MAGISYALGRAWGRLGPWGRAALAGAALLAVFIWPKPERPAPDMSDPDAVPRYLAAQAASAAEAREAALTPEERATRERQEQEVRAKDAATEKAMAGLAKLDWWDACARWGREARRSVVSVQSRAAERFLASNGLTRDADSAPVYAKNRLPSVGMSACGVIALMGVPDHQNVTTTAALTRVQMVYRDRSVYVYVQGPAGQHNGVVTSVQY